jgi:hypothetical protein
MATNYKIIEGSRKNSTVYVFASKLYLVDKKKKDKGTGSCIYLRCKNYKVGDGCRARAYIEKNKFVVTIPVHCCGENQEYIHQELPWALRQGRRVNNRSAEKFFLSLF